MGQCLSSSSYYPHIRDRGESISCIGGLLVTDKYDKIYTRISSGKNIRSSMSIDDNYTIVNMNHRYTVDKLDKPLTLTLPVDDNIDNGSVIEVKNNGKERVAIRSDVVTMRIGKIRLSKVYCPDDAILRLEMVDGEWIVVI